MALSGTGVYTGVTWTDLAESLYNEDLCSSDASVCPWKVKQLLSEYGSSHLAHGHPGRAGATNPAAATALQNNTEHETELRGVCLDIWNRRGKLEGHFLQTCWRRGSKSCGLLCSVCFHCRC